jgi:prephenate dehydrogenase
MTVNSDDGPFAVLGLGLIGGSIARDLAARKACVLGFDADRHAVNAARRAHVISRVIDAGLGQLREARTVILAAPVDAAIDLLTRAAPFLDRATLITDVGSTKGAIVAHAQALGLGDRFVGSHPLAGDHRSGWVASRRALFEGAQVFVCPTRTSTAATIRRTHAFWRSVGARTLQMAAKAHDAKVAYTSHLPHLLSAALARTLERAGHAHSALGPGGRDVTRLASSSPDMWSAIVGANGPLISQALTAFAEELQLVRRAAARGNSGAIHELFTATGDWAS